MRRRPPARYRLTDRAYDCLAGSLCLLMAAAILAIGLHQNGVLW